MKNIESFEESVEFHVQPQRIFKTFTATIFETDQIFQDVIIYPTHLDGDVLDVEIKMPLLVKPYALRDDVQDALRSEYNLQLGNLKFSNAPQNYSI